MCPVRVGFATIGPMGHVSTLYHWTRRDRLASILRDGLDTRTEYPDWGLEMRKGITYCWFRPQDNPFDKDGKSPEHEYLKLAVDTDLCTVADMMYINLAQMYDQGGCNKPKIGEAAILLARLYEATAVPLAAYRDGMFRQPEILVRGPIAASAIRRETDSSG